MRVLDTVRTTGQVAGNASAKTPSGDFKKSEIKLSPMLYIVLRKANTSTQFVEILLEKNLLRWIRHILHMDKAKRSKVTLNG